VNINIKSKIVKIISFLVGISPKIKKAKNKVESTPKNDNNTEIDNPKFEITTIDKNQENQEKNQLVHLYI
jgi:hypothetical protein